MEWYAAPPFHKRKKGVHADAHLFGGLGGLRPLHQTGDEGGTGQL